MEENGRQKAEEQKKINTKTMQNIPFHVHAHATLVNLTRFSVRQQAIAHVLEAGIGIHSVIIGIALGVVTSYPSILSLLIALVFHQIFEGVCVCFCICASVCLAFICSLHVCCSFCRVMQKMGLGAAIAQASASLGESVQLLYSLLFLLSPLLTSVSL